MMDREIIEQLNEIYKKEWWHKVRLSDEEINKYHTKLLSLGNIITVSDGDILCGYVEYWRLSFEQFGRIICGEPFSAYHEDVQTGQLAYVAHCFIKEEYRGLKVYKQLHERFLEVNKPCTHFVGVAMRKKTQPLKIFTRKELYG